MKKYQVIYADPPWMYNDKRKVKDMRSVGGSSSGFGASEEYSVMSMSMLHSLRVDQIADDNCVLFLWSTSPFLREAIELMKRWGFEYKTVAFVWAKTRSKGSFARLLGRWTMGSCEYVLLGTKGNPKRIQKNTYQLLVEEHASHSLKPNTIRKRIVALMGDVSRIELFARNRTEGWDIWGNEVESDIEL